MIFMPNDDALEAQSKKVFEEVATKEGLKVLGWRKVPVKTEVVGRFAKATQASGSNRWAVNLSKSISRKKVAVAAVTPR